MLESTSHDFVFASGDCASIVNNPNQKAGVFAVRAHLSYIEILRIIFLQKN